MNIHELYEAMSSDACFKDMHELEANGRYRIFMKSFDSEGQKDPNCPRISYAISCEAYDFGTHKLYDSCSLVLSNNLDLQRWSAALNIRSNGADMTALVSVTYVEIFPASVHVNDFLKLLRHKPIDADFKDPKDSLGLTVVEFERHNGYEANIEFGVDGKLYFEVLDMNSYEEGEVLPLDSPRRKDVIWYEVIRGNEKKLAEKIDRSLDKIYNQKGSSEND